MAIAANKYANKIYSEHPIALWSLDDEAYYLSLIDDTNRLFTNWNDANAEDRVNLISNPSFEASTSFWTVSAGSTLTRITTDKVFGTACLEITKSATTQTGASTGVTGIVAGETYTISAYVKVPAGNQDSIIRVWGDWSTGAAYISTIASSNTDITTSAMGWRRISVTGVAPATAKQINVYVLQTVTGTAGQKFLVDGVMLEKSSTVNTYFDGSYGGGAWTGTDNSSASVIHAKDRVNIVPNPSFETNVTGWASQNSSAFVRSTAQFLNGAASGLFTANGGVNAGPYYATRLPVTAGKTYTLSAYVRDINTAQQFLAQIQWWTAVTGGTNLSNSTSAGFTVTSTGWTRVFITATAPATATHALVWIATVGTPTNGTQAYVDSYLFEESSIAYPYFDGAQTSISYGGTAYTIAPTWSGTAHASTSVLTQWAANDSPTIPDTTSPFPNGVYTSVIKSNSLAGVVEVESPEIFDILDLDSSNTSFTVNTFLYHNPTYINWFKIGYRYTNAGVVNTVVSSEIPPLDSTGWININQTFSLPSSYTGGIRVFIQANFKNSTAGDTESRTVIMNGLSVGQGSSLTCYESLGSTAIDLPSELGFASLKGISADQYGTLSDNGYYIVKSNKILAHNEAMSMIYGTDNSTRIEASGSSDPSLIFPGKGMLHENGRNKEFTFEMWMKIDPQTLVSKRILGPLDSTDGVYVKEGFITLVIGDNIGSHYVGEWYRPMLIQIILKESNAILMINGEEVVNIDYPRATVALSNGRDWWGVYSYTSTKFFAIDCIAIYPYVISEVLAKRRFVYGQGTENAQTLDAAYSGIPTVIDFSTAEYGANVIYPDAYRWDAGYFNNLDATRDYISVPKYSLPNINIGGRDVQEWYDDNYAINLSEYPSGNHPKFISFRPNYQYISESILNDGAVAYWKLNETTGTVAANSVSGGTNATYAGSPTLDAGMLANDGSSVLLNGTTQYVNIGDQANVNLIARDDTTVEGWMVCTDVSLLTPQIIFEEGGQTNGISIYVYNGQLYALAWASSVIFKQISHPVVSGETYHFAFVSGVTNNTCKLYINGVSVGTPTVNTATQLPAHSGDMAIGAVMVDSRTHLAGISGGPLNFFGGKIAHIAIYNKFLNSEQIYGRYSGWCQSAGTNYQDPSYFNFSSLNVLNDEVAAAYGVFEAESDTPSDRTLISFSNTINGDSLDIKINSNEVIYSLNGTELYSEVITLGNEFLVGLSIADASAEYGYEISKFFSSPSSIQVYVGGNGVNTFEGKIYTVGFCNNNNYSDVSANFYSVSELGGGFAKADNYEALIDHIASYTLIPEYEYDKLFLDISVASEWEEFYPLSYFASYTKDANGDTVYDIDMLQLNLGYVTVESAGWTYAELNAEFIAPDDYADLATSVYTSYLGLKNNNSTGTTANVSNSSLQGYLTFQSIADGANNPLSEFTYTKLLDTSRIIYVDDENTIPLPTKAYDTKFVFTDDTLVFPPTSQPFDDYAMVVHLDIKQRAILTNPLKVKRFEITTKPYNQNSSITDQRTHIGTKFGKYIYPYVQTGSTLNNKGQKPLSISKMTVPYLYNSSKTGIGIRNKAVQGITPVSDTQIFIPVNENGAQDYLVSSLQIMVKPNFDDAVETIKLFHVKHKGGTLAYALVKDGTEYALLREYTKDSETVYTPYSYVNFYQNGRYVASPILRNNEWTTIGLVFPNGLDFSQFTSGGITIFGGARFNNISYYLSDGLGIQTTLSTRVWQDVLDENGVGATLWSYWSGGSWFDAYILDITSSYIVTPSDIYDAYMGTNGSIIDDGKGLQINQGQTKIITDASWSLISGKPV